MWNDDIGTKALNFFRNMDGCVRVEDGVGVGVRPSDIDEWTPDTGCCFMLHEPVPHRTTA